MNNNIGANQYEVMGTAYYENKVWLGASYRQSYGMSAFAGGMVDKFDFSYIYTFPSIASDINQPSHELVLRYRLGKNKKAASAKLPEEVNDPYDINNYLHAEDESSQIESEPEAEDILVTDVDTEEQYTLKPGYYIVLGQFYLKSSTLKFRNDLELKRMDGKVIYLHHAELYYMYADYFENEEDAKHKLEEAKTQSITTDPWIYVVN